MANIERKFRYCCIRCYKENNNIQSHLTYCKGAIENVDFIRCKLCNHKGLTLYIHIQKHNLTIEEYEKEHGSAYCKNTLISISLRNSITQKKSNYRSKLKKENRLEELEAFNKKTAKSVSKTILSNKNERKRRSILLGNLNKTDTFRKKASQTAIKTSARKDIQDQRSRRLKVWREENPEKFLEIISKAHRFQSEPEKELFKYIKTIDGFFFKRNQLLKRTNVFLENISNAKQIDIFEKQKKIVVEFDGEFHFFNVKKWNQLEKVKKTDNQLNSLAKEFCIIRVGYDQFSYKKNDYGFKKECLDCLNFLITENKKGLYCLGEAYGQNNFLQSNWKASNV